MPAEEIRVSGKVQGVFFRASAKEKAEALGLTGYVQNEEDGGVRLVAEGSRENLDQLISWCHQGPARAVVTQVVVHPVTEQGFAQFTIKR